MIKQLSAITAFLVLLPISVISQTVDRRVNEIRERYNEVSVKALLADTDEDAAAGGEIVVNELRVNSRNRKWRAVGIYNGSFKFYYTGGDTEKSLYPDRLVFVKIERNISARKIYEELLFSDAGALMFYFRRTDGDGPTPDEKRIYFANGRAIRVNDNGKVLDKLNAADRKNAGDGAALAQRLKTIFISTFHL